MSKRQQQVESRMVSEYLLNNYSKFEHFQPQPLGTVPDELARLQGMGQALRTFRPFRPYVDAVVILPRHLVIIEAKVWQPLAGMAKLPFYKSLVPVTPELQKYMPREVIMECVVGQVYDNLQTMARDQGIRLVVYNPPWLQEVVDGMNKYWTPEYRRKREEKNRMREYFGLE